MKLVAGVVWIALVGVFLLYVLEPRHEPEKTASMKSVHRQAQTATQQQPPFVDNPNAGVLGLVFIKRHERTSDISSMMFPIILVRGDQFIETVVNIQGVRHPVFEGRRRFTLLEAGVDVGEYRVSGEEWASFGCADLLVGMGRLALSPDVMLFNAEKRPVRDISRKDQDGQVVNETLTQFVAVNGMRPHESGYEYFVYEAHRIDLINDLVRLGDPYLPGESEAWVDQVRVFDLDGDDWAEVTGVLMEGDQKWRVWMSYKENGTPYILSITKEQPGEQRTLIDVVDVNGDGKGEVLMQVNSKNDMSFEVWGIQNDGWVILFEGGGYRC